MWTGAHGARALRTTARFADVANWNVGLAEFVRLGHTLDEACAEVGRDRAEVETSVFRIADLTDDGSALTALLEAEGIPVDLADQVAAEHFVGSTERVAEQVQGFVDAGARHIVVMFAGADTSLESAARFARGVIPRVRQPQA